MNLAPGTHRIGPRNSSLVVRTGREGSAAKLGHDLIIDVTGWQATLKITDDPASWAVELKVDPDSLEVREGTGGVKPLTDDDRSDILGTIEKKVLLGKPIAFHSTSVRPSEKDGSITVEGELTIAGETRPFDAELQVEAGGRVSSTLRLAQSEWGIKPHSALLGQLKVADDVEVEIEASVS